MTELTSNQGGEVEVVRVAAADISFAWQQVLQGNLVDISAALSSAEGGEVEVVRVAAADISFAWQQVLQGNLVDISAALSSAEGGEVPDEDYEEYIKDVQDIFDGITQTVNSPEYAVIAGGVRETLKEVKGQHFIFDLEGVVLADVKDSSTGQIVYYPLPWMMPLIRTLMENGNTVVF